MIVDASLLRSSAPRAKEETRLYGRVVCAEKSLKGSHIAADSVVSS